MHFEQLGGPMNNRIRRTFTPEFRLESTQLVVDQNYTIAMEVSNRPWIKG